MKKLLLPFVLLISLVAKSTEKKIWFNNNQLEITSIKQACSDLQNGIEQEKMLFTFQNKTNNKLSVSFERQLWFDNQKANQSSTENRFVMVLEPNQTLQGNCTLKDKALVVFSKQLNLKGRELSKLTIENIQITTLEK